MATESEEAKTLRETPGLFWGVYILVPVALLAGCVAARLRWEAPGATALIALVAGAAAVLLWLGLEAVYQVYWRGRHRQPSPRERPQPPPPAPPSRPPTLEGDLPPPSPEVATQAAGVSARAGFNKWLREHEPLMKFVSFMIAIVGFAFTVSDHI